MRHGRRLFVLTFLVPPLALYAFHPLPGIQIWRYQITYITPRRSAFLTKNAARLLPYVLSLPLAATFWKPDLLAEKSQARPLGCSPEERSLKQDV